MTRQEECAKCKNNYCQCRECRGTKGRCYNVMNTPCTFNDNKLVTEKCYGFKNEDRNN